MARVDPDRVLAGAVRCISADSALRTADSRRASADGARGDAMSAPGWYKALPRWAQETIDQSAHVAIGLVAASVLWIGQPILAGMAAAAWASAVREREQWPPRRWWDLVLDVASVIVGGLVMGLIVWAVS